MTRKSDGFSLIELMMAMLITVMVSGAIYALLSAGGNAFRREPSVADRQQNIRVAMDTIARDVYEAGAGLPTFSQVFTVTDPAGGSCAAGLDGCGIPGSMAAANSDVLEMVSANESCVQTVCNQKPGGTADRFVTREGVPQCFGPLPALALVTDGSAFAIQPAGTDTATACAGGSTARNGTLRLSAALAPWVGPVTQCGGDPCPMPTATQVFLYAGRVVRYRLGNSTDNLERSGGYIGNNVVVGATPALWRSVSGRYALDGTTPAEPGTPGFTGSAPWQLVASGIDDLQIQYLDGNGAWTTAPQVSALNDWTTLVQRVRITISARVLAANAAGQTISPNAANGVPNAQRGQLVTEVAPRAALTEMQMCLSPTATPTNLAPSPCPQNLQIR